MRALTLFVAYLFASDEDAAKQSPSAGWKEGYVFSKTEFSCVGSEKMSCRPVQTVPQSTRTYIVRRLDDADHKLTLQKKARGQECLDKVRVLANFRSDRQLAGVRWLRTLVLCDTYYSLHET